MLRFLSQMLVMKSLGFRQGREETVSLSVHKLSLFFSYWLVSVCLTGLCVFNSPLQHSLGNLNFQHTVSKPPSRHWKTWIKYALSHNSCFVAQALEKKRNLQSALHIEDRNKRLSFRTQKHFRKHYSSTIRLFLGVLWHHLFFGFVVAMSYLLLCSIKYCCVLIFLWKVVFSIWFWFLKCLVIWKAVAFWFFALFQEKFFCFDVELHLLLFLFSEMSLCLLLYKRVSQHAGPVQQSRFNISRVYSGYLA